MKRFIDSWMGTVLLFTGAAFGILAVGQIFGGGWLESFTAWLPVWGGVETAVPVITTE